MKVIYVADYQPELLPRPTPYIDVLDSDRVEQLKDLNIIKISGIDGDYHDNDISGVHQ